MEEPSNMCRLVSKRGGYTSVEPLMNTSINVILLRHVTVQAGVVEDCLQEKEGFIYLLVTHYSR